MNITGFSIKPLSVPVDGDTRDRRITGYAIMDGEDSLVAEFVSFGLASAAWDMIVNETDDDKAPPILMPWRFTEDGEARPAL